MANKNRIYTTLSPTHCRLVKAISESSGKSESQIVAEAVKQKFDSIPFFEKERLLKK